MNIPLPTWDVLVRALTEREAHVVTLAVRGLPTKLIAYELGLSPSTICKLMSSAATKIGATSTTDLVRIAGLAQNEPRTSSTMAMLSGAEREVLELIERGLTNDRIAALRSRSVRTIANQVASILRKTKEPSRRALVAARARGAL